MQAVAKQYGVSVAYKGGTFSGNSVVQRWEFAVISESGQVLDRSADEFKRYASGYGLSAADLGAQFQSGGQTFTITGLNTKARKMPIQGVDQAGRRMKFAAALVLMGLGRTVPPWLARKEL